MAIFDDIRFGPERNRKEAEAIAKRILSESRKKKETLAKYPYNASMNSFKTQNQDEQEKEILAEEIEKKEEEIEKLKEEQKVLRGLASSGIVLASFSHDLGQLNSFLNSRVDKLKNLIYEKVAESDYINIEDRKNPYYQLEKMKKDDLKLQNWLNFSLGVTRKDKRKRKQLFLKKYFNNLKVDWAISLENRAIEFNVSEIEDIDLRVFEIDFDSIFHNLLVNSIDAFNISQINRERKIIVIVKSNLKEIIIDYFDNGPGLSIDIENPNLIFEPLFTTKRNEFTGEEEGTGLGMWIVKSIIEENDGLIKLLYPEEGFGLRIFFPIKYKR